MFCSCKLDIAELNNTKINDNDVSLEDRADDDIGTVFVGSNNENGDNDDTHVHEDVSDDHNIDCDDDEDGATAAAADDDDDDDDDDDIKYDGDIVEDDSDEADDNKDSDTVDEFDDDGEDEDDAVAADNKYDNDGGDANASE